MHEVVVVVVARAGTWCHVHLGTGHCVHRVPGWLVAAVGPWALEPPEGWGMLEIEHNVNNFLAF